MWYDANDTILQRQNDVDVRNYSSLFLMIAV